MSDLWEQFLLDEAKRKLVERRSLVALFLPVVVVSCLLLAGYYEAERYCWDGTWSLLGAITHLWWIAPAFAFLLHLTHFYFLVEADRERFAPVTLTQRMTAGAVLISVFGFGIYMGVWTDPQVRLRCALKDVRDAPDSAPVWIGLGDVYRMDANEEAPSDVAEGAAPINLAIDAYLKAVKLDPQSWVPISKVAQILLAGGQCDLGGEWSARAREKIRIIQDERVREQAEDRFGGLTWSQEGCEYFQELEQDILDELRRLDPNTPP